MLATMWHLLFVFFLSVPYNVVCADADDDGVIYDKFTAEPVTDEALAHFESTGVTRTCTIKVKTCDESEPRRSDGTCNNLDKPSTGTFLNPHGRLLPAVYYQNSKARLASNGKNMTASRIARNTLLHEGKSISLDFTQAVPSFLIFTFGDFGSTHDISFFLINKTDCCDPAHMNDEMCTPNIIAEDDPVHKLTGIRCLNLTKPLDYQYLGCTNDSTPAPIAKATGIMDLSQIYNAEDNGEEAIRLYEGGLLMTETDENGVVWPPQGYSEEACIGNVEADETRCWKNYPSSLLGITMVTLWFLRNHNYCATELAKVNPNWTDEQLFQKARDINIATYMHILYDEAILALFGEQILIERGVRLTDNARIDRYDKTKVPSTPLEFSYFWRYFHTAQEPVANKYDSDGNVIGSFLQTQIAFRPGFTGKEDNLRKYTPSAFRQSCSDIGNGVDPEMTLAGLQLELQKSTDIITSDLHKGLTLGISPYVLYANYLYGVNITNWEDLKPFFSDEKIALLKSVYPDVVDIEAMAAAWLDNHVEGGHISRLVATTSADFFHHNIISDRHWYERPNRPGAFTDGQLEEVKRMSLASLICTNGDGVTDIQAEAFRVASELNPVVSCDDIPKMDFTVFAEEA